MAWIAGGAAVALRAQSAIGAARGCPCRSRRCRAATARWALLAAQRLRQLQIALRGRRQVDQLARALDLQRADVRQRLALRVLGIAQQRGGGGVGQASGLAR
jgi:hypothetical protein